MRFIIVCFFLVFFTRLSFTQELPCVDRYSDSLATHSTRQVYITSAGDSLFGTIYMPGNGRPKGLVIIVSGGGNDAEILRITPRFLSRRMANCGLATFMFDKRGVGLSGGEYAQTDFNDFINDVSVIADYLGAREEFKGITMGAVGLSQGGRLVPNIAIKNNKIRFIASISGPIAEVGATRNYAFRNSVLESQLSDSVQQIILPLWDTHFAALDKRDWEALRQLDVQIVKHTNTLPAGLLPPFSKEIPKMPIYNSMGMDFVSELDQLDVPWLCLYGERDRVVPVETSISNIKREMNEGGNTEYEIVVIPKGDHNLRNVETGVWYPMERVLTGWILKQVSEPEKKH